MATIYEYLDKKRQENPELYIYDDYELYDRLKKEGVQIPSWDRIDTRQKQKITGQKRYERKQNPDSVNAFYDWNVMDYGINENSAGWAKSAYNNSITGLAYQLYNGEQRFDMDDYNPGMAEDIFSMVLSFMMPMDLASIAIGGGIAKAGIWGGTKLAGEGFRRAATKNLIDMGARKGGVALAKKELAKETAEQLAKRTGHITQYIDNLLSKGSYNALFSEYAPRAAASIGQGVTLGTFEGARGGMQAAVDGEDVWEGIGHGVMHGGIMGGLAGFAGASLNLTHAKLFAKAQKGPLTKREMFKKRMLEGAPGVATKIGVEAGVFTAPELKNWAMDEDYTARDLFRSFFVNAGMMGVLKAKSKAGSALWGKGKASLRDFMEKEGVLEARANESADSAWDGVSKSIKESLGEGENPNMKKTGDFQKKMANEFVANARRSKKAGVTKEEYNNWEPKFDKATKLIETSNETTIKKAAFEDIANVYKQVLSVYEAMERNISSYKTDNLEATTARKGKLKDMKDLRDSWIKEIMKPLNDIEKAQELSKPISEADKTVARMSFRTAFDTALKKSKKGDKAPMQELLRDMEGIDPKTGEITATDNAAFVRAAERAKVWKSEYLDIPPLPIKKIADVEMLKQEKFEEFKKDETEAFDKTIDEKLAEIRASDRTPKPKGIATEIVAFEGEIRKSTLDKKIHTKDPKNKFNFDPTEIQAKKYEESKDILSYISTELARKKNPIENASEHLQIADKFARFLAKKDKSLLEIEDKFIEEYVFDNPASHKWGISNMVKAISDISSKYSGILKKGFSLNDGPSIGELYRERQMGDKVEGILSTDAELSPTVINEKGTITVGTKTVPKIKPITKTLAKMLKALNLRAKINKLDGHKDFLMTDTKGEALIDVDANFLIRKYFGPRIQKSGGEARAFRYSLEQYAKAKWGEGSVEFHMIDKYSIGHGADPKVSKRYSDAVEAKGGVDTFTRELIREYLKDIENGEYKNVSGKTVSMKNLKKGIRQSGYYPEEIKKGLEKIKNAPDIINYKVGGKDKSIDRFTLEAMAKYAIETGPRIREIVPTKKTLDATIEFSHQTISDAYLKGEQIIEGFASSKEFQNQIKLTKKFYPKFTINLENSLGKFRGQTVIGRIKGNLIKIAKGLVQPDTLPHELSHDVVDILKATGSSHAKKLIKEGVRLFGSEEAFVDSLGKYTREAWRGKKTKDLKFFDNKTLMGRMKSWIRRTMHYLGDYFGISNPQDVARMQKEIIQIIGEKVAKADVPTDYMPPESQIKIHHQLKKPNPSPEYKKTHKRTILREKSLMEGTLKYTKEELRKFLGEITGERTRSLEWSQKEPLSHHELELYEKSLKSLSKSEVGNKSKNESKNEAYIDDTTKNLEIRYDITNELREHYFKTYHNTTFAKANEFQVKNYRSYIEKGVEVVSINNSVLDGLISLNSNRKNSGLPLWKRALMTSGDVVRIYGGKAGRALAIALDKHDHLRSRLRGYGEDKIDIIKDIVNNKNVRKNYMHMIDKNLAKNSISSMRELIKDIDTKIKEAKKEGDKTDVKNLTADKYRFQKELNEMTEVALDFSKKGGQYEQAGKIWKELTDYYWRHLGINILRNTKGKREYQEIMDKLNEKFVQQYFTRRVTKNVLEFLNKESSQIQRLVDLNIKDLTTNDLKRAAKSILEPGQKITDIGYKDFKEFSKGKEVRDLIAEEIMAMIEFGPAKVKPAFLKERSNLLDEYVEITKDDGTKELVKAYETSLDGTMNHYVNGMAKFLSTVRYFPEFTELGGKFSLKSNQKINTLEMMGKSSTMGAYGYELIKRQLGMDYSMKDVLMNPMMNISGKVTNISAVIGLSSPTAGIKNVLIQLPRSVAVYGARNTLRGMSFAFRTYNDPKLMSEAVQRGETGYGQKEIIREAGQKKYVKFVFEKVNLMEQTENFNRIVTAEAGRLHFQELLNVARGTASFFLPQGNKAEIERMFKETWKLSDADIKYLIQGENILGTQKYQEILSFVGHQSHKASAGATGVSDLPLWMSGRYIKPLTLFQRMAMSVTIDSYKNYIKPMKNGNFAPIIKASIGHGMSGVALFWMYDKLLGQQPPKEESPFLDRAMANIWRGEFLGVFGELLSPYDKPGLSSPIMEPVIIRNARAAGGEILNWLNYGKNLDQAIKDFTFQSVVGLGQLEKGWNKINHPYVTNTKRIKTLQRQWEKQMEFPSGAYGEFLSKRQPYYFKLKQAIMFDKSDAEIAKVYYSAYNFILNELENSSNITSKVGRMKEARKSIDSVIRNMNPLNVSDETKYKRESKRNEFLKWLSKDNKELALKLEKEFKYKERLFYNIVKQYKWKQRYSVYPD